MSEEIYTAYLEGDLLLNARGDWIHRGVPFANPKLSELFHRSIVWDESSRRYLVRIGRQQATFRVEDCAYFVVRLLDEKTPWEITLKDGSCETLREESLEFGSSSTLYTRVKGNHLALFLSAAYQRFVEHIEDDHTVVVNGKKLRIPVR